MEEKTFKVIIDTREKTPWEFEHPCIEETISKKLDTGDYSVEGMETSLCIERKRSVQEVAINVREPRFIEELKRMQTYKHRFIICEFSVDDIVKYPLGSKIPKSRWKNIRITGAFILKCIARFQTRYNVHVIFAGDTDNAILLATNIMKDIVENA